MTSTIMVFRDFASVEVQRGTLIGVCDPKKKNFCRRPSEICCAQFVRYRYVRELSS